MARLAEEFLAEEIPEDDRSFDPIPAGDYTMQVIDSDIQPTKSGSGDQLILTLEVIDGPHAKRRIWDRLNIRNQNADAQRISQRSLAELMLAIGLTALRDTEDLHFKPFIGRVTIKQDKTGQYGPQNAVRYKGRGGQPPAARPTQAAHAQSAGIQQTKTAQASQTHPAQAASSSNGNRPWANKTA